MFWHLNPKKLEPFRKKAENEARQRTEEIDYMAWRIGYYETQAMGVWWGNNISYPEHPETYTKAQEGKGVKITDADKFAAYAAKHRQAIAARRSKENPQG